MSQRNSTGHCLPALFERIRGSADKNSMREITLVGLSMLCLVGEATATATQIAALSLGWLLLRGVLTVKRDLNQPSECLAKVGRVRPRPLRPR